MYNGFCLSMIREGGNMNTTYTVTFFYKDGQTNVVPGQDAKEVTQMIFEEITKNPSCCANVLIKEFDEANPNKSWVKIHRYENKNGHIEKVPY
jgi:hypothetical protein